MRALLTLAVLPLVLASPSHLSAQDQKAANPAAAPPNVLVLVRQEFPPGKSSERRKLLTNISRASDRLETPSYWISLQSLTGSQEALSFDPFQSFEEVEQAKTGWSQFFAAHPDLGQMQEGLQSLLFNERTIIAVRRDDLGYFAENIDLSEARYLRVLEVRLFPGHDADSAEGLKILADAFTAVQSDTPWVVYQVEMGEPTPAFIIFMPMPELKQNDDFISIRQNLLAAIGEQSAETLKKIARESIASTETNLYTVNPEMSHVSKEFAAGDPDFWKPKATPDQNSDTKPKPKPTINR